MPRRCPRCRTYTYDNEICSRCGRYTLETNVCPKCFNEKQERNVGHLIFTTASRFTKEGEIAWSYDITDKKKVRLYQCNKCGHVFRGEYHV